MLIGFALVVGFPVWLPLLAILFAILGLFALLIPFLNRLQEARLRSMLKSRGRWLSAEEFERRVRSGESTVIVQYPAIGWPTVRVWWTGDNVVAQLGLPPNEEEFERATARIAEADEAEVPAPIVHAARWTRSCKRAYTDVTLGQAFGTIPPAWKSRDAWIARLEQGNPDLQVVRVDEYMLLASGRLEECCRCGHSLRGLPSNRKGVRCPECGLVQSANPRRHDAS